MTHRTFSLADQIDFATLSGDFNPLHVDPVRARRLMFGAPAVHGVHTLLWALDQWSKGREDSVALREIKAVFPRPLKVDQTVEFLVRKNDGQKVRLVALSGTDTVARIDFEWATVSGEPPFLRNDTFSPTQPVEHHVYDGLQGELPLSLDRALAARLLPHLTARLAPEQIATLLACTRLVGMESPGLHSVFSELNLGFADRDVAPIGWSVTQTDTRFGLLVMALGGSGVTGEIRAFIRPAPRKQLSFAKACALVPSGAFAGQRALVVGGSRGLGEVVVKLLAAGGAQVMATYKNGHADAQTLIDEINTGGGVAACAPLDVLAASDPEGRLAARAVTHLYYFATPFIATGPNGGFDRGLFDTFSAYYVAGLFGTTALIDGSLEAIFCPSSIFVEETPDILTEYAAAKAAGEFACDVLARRRVGLRVCHPRLPKMGTDQTAALGDAEDADPAPIMLEHLLRFART
ncbi:MAG: hypothetical protein EON96_02785 [Caulobacteraceae bacterium]|nr:MAG: hypothetical protein EON96_02785 [Caulobacteraceae bacterium]